MASVDDRVVRMQFDNAAFESKLHTTIASLGALDKALKLEGAQKGLTDVSAAAGKFNMGNIAAGVEGVSAKFAALATIGITALSRITNAAISTGIQIAKSLTIAPMKAGFEEYELNMNSIQTVLANTRDKGTNLQDVNSALDQLNTYADKTIYNFGQMTKNIGTFTSAGVDLKTSVDSIKGISNIAAISGSSADQASSAMYQLSQAVASGSVKLQDWNSVVNSGMGGEVFQKSLFETGKALGTLKDVPMEQTFKQWTDSGHSFRESLKDGWITSDVLTTTLQGFTGEMTVAELKAKGFTDAQAASIVEMGKVGLDAATKVRTFSQLMDTTKEAIGSGWSETFRNIFGDFNQATDLFTMISGAFGKMISFGADARNALLKGWNVFGGRNAAIEALIHAFDDLKRIINPIRLAFRSIFPRETVMGLINTTKGVRDFMIAIKPSQSTMVSIAHIFRGFFAVLKIGWTIIKGTVGFIKTLIGTLVGLGGGGVLKFAANIGDLFFALEQFLVEGKGISTFFEGLAAVFTGAVGAVKAFASGIIDLISGLNIGIPQGVLDFFTSFKEKAAGLFDGLSTDKFAGIISFFGRLQETIANFFGSLNGDNIKAVGNSVTDAAAKVNIFGRVFERVAQIWEDFKTATRAVALVIGGIAKVVYEAFKGIGTAIGKAFSGGNFSGAFDLLNVALIGGVILTIRKFSKAIEDFDWTGGIFDNLKKVVGELVTTLKTMQLKIKSEAILKIAQAVAVLALSAIALSLVDSVALAKGMSAMAVGFGELVGTLKALDSFKGKTGAKDFIALSVGMNVLALSMLSMSFAVAKLGKMSNDDLTRGLIAVAVLLGVVTGASVLLSKHTSGLLSSSLAIRTMAVALGVLAGVVKIFASMDTKDIVKGLTAIAASLGILVLAVNLVPKDVGKVGVQILIISFALIVLAGAVKAFAAFDMKSMMMGLFGIFGTLGLIVAAMNLLPPDMEAKSVGLLAIAGALVIIAIALKIMGGMNMGDIATGIIGIALILALLAVGMDAMEQALPGAAALLVAAVALRVLADVIKTFADIGWKDMLSGILMLAVAMGVLGIAGYLLEPAVPGLLGFAAALLVLGAAIALIGVGVLMFAKSFALLSSTGDSGSKKFIAAMKTIGEALPAIFEGAAEGVLSFIEVFVKAAPKLVEEFIKILGMILEGLNTLIPQAGEIISTLIQTLIGIIRENVPIYLLLGMDILMAFLQGIRDRIGDIVTVVADIITNFINALSENMQQIIDAGVNLLVTFLQGIGNDAGQISMAMSDLIIKIINAIASFEQSIIDAGVVLLVKFLFGITRDLSLITNAVTTLITQFITDVGNSADRIITAATDMIIKFVTSLGDNAFRVVDAVTKVIDKFVTEVGEQASKIVTAGADAIIKFVEGLGKNAQRIVTAGEDAIVKFLEGVSEDTLAFANACMDVIINFVNGLAEAIRAHNDDFRNAGLNIAGAIADGITGGLASKVGSVVGGAKDLAGKVVGGIAGVFKSNSPSKVTMEMGVGLAEGLQIGMGDGTHLAEAGAEDLAQSTIDVFSNLLGMISDNLGTMPEFNPVITPVLDLTGIQTEAAKIGEYVNTAPSIAPMLSYSKAKDIAYSVNGQADQTPENSPGVTGSVQFNQTINAPEQLSVADIYKQTRNQITMAKEELKIP